MRINIFVSSIESLLRHTALYNYIIANSTGKSINQQLICKTHLNEVIYVRLLGYFIVEADGFFK